MRDDHPALMTVTNNCPSLTSVTFATKWQLGMTCSGLGLQDTRKQRGRTSRTARTSEKSLLFLDGATGSNLQMRGMPNGESPEKWVLENPQVLFKLQREYVEAGSNIIYAPTFTSNRIKLAEYGLQDRIEEINTRLVELSKEASGKKALVAGDITMTGRQLAPMGTMDFEELVDIYKE